MFKTHTKTDLSGLNKLRQNIRKSVEVEGRAGFEDSQEHPTSPINLAQIAYYNNFGSAQNFIPRRKFFTKAARDSSRKVGTSLGKEWVNILKGKSPRPVLNKTSKYLARYISDVIENNNFKRNAPYTVIKKGFNNPLTETGYLAKNVKTKVSDKDGET